MSKYQDMSEIKNNAEFQEFVKLELNRDIDSIRDYELTAMFYKFKQHTGDIDKQDQEFLDNTAKTATPEELDNLTKVHFPNKKYEELTTEDKTFINVENQQAKDLGLTIDDIKAYLDITSRNDEVSPADSPAFRNNDDVYEAFHELADKHRYTPNNQQDFDDFIKQKDAYLANKTPEEKTAVEEQLNKFLNNQDQEKMHYGNELYTVDDDFRKMYNTASLPQQTAQKTPIDIIVEPLDNDEKQQPAQKPTKHNGIKQNKGEEQDEIRLRSFNSDQNEALLDMIKVETLHEMDIVSDDEINKASKQSKNSVQTSIDILNDKLPKLSDKQLSEFEERITNKMVDNDELLNLMPPAALAKAYTGIEKQLDAEKDDAKKQDLISKK